MILVGTEDQEDFNIEDIIEIESYQMKIVKNKLKELSRIGGRLFWDFRMHSNFQEQNKVEIKVSGTNEQIQQVKKQIKFYIDSETSK